MTGKLLHAEVTREQVRETETIARHIEISLNELIQRQNLKLGELLEQQQRGDSSPLLAANTKQKEAPGAYRAGCAG